MKQKKNPAIFPTPKNVKTKTPSFWWGSCTPTIRKNRGLAVVDPANGSAPATTTLRRLAEETLLKRVLQADKRLKELRALLKQEKTKPRQDLFLTTQPKRRGWKSRQEALMAELFYDVEEVIRSHKIALLKREIEQREKEITHCFFSFFGLKYHEDPIPVPPTRKPEEDKRFREIPLESLWADDLDYEPPQEILELFREDQDVWEANGSGKRGNGGLKARLAETEMLSPGVRPVKAYGSSGKPQKVFRSSEKLQDEAAELIGGDGKRRIGVWRVLDNGEEVVEIEEIEELT